MYVSGVCVKLMFCFRGFCPLNTVIFVQMMHGTVFAPIQYIVMYICFEFEEKKHILVFQL